MVEYRIAQHQQAAVRTRQLQDRRQAQVDRGRFLIVALGPASALDQAAQIEPDRIEGAQTGIELAKAEGIGPVGLLSAAASLKLIVAAWTLATGIRAAASASAAKVFFKLISLVGWTSGPYGDVATIKHNLCH